MKSLTNIGLLLDIIGVVILFWQDYKPYTKPPDEQLFWNPPEPEWNKQKWIRRVGFGFLALGFTIQLIGNNISQ